MTNAYSMLANVEATCPEKDVADIAAQLQRVIDALCRVRIRTAGQAECSLQDELCLALAQSGVAYKREYKFGPRCRADIWVDGIVIEIKRLRPATAALHEQLRRYAEQPASRAFIAVHERSVRVPREINGKPVRAISMNTLWGVAL